jgi:hypothetical protein
MAAHNKAIDLALDVLPDGTREEVLGLWIENTEEAKFRPTLSSDHKHRNVADILTAVTDGIKGMGEAPTAAFPPKTGHRGPDPHQRGICQLERPQAAGRSPHSSPSNAHPAHRLRSRRWMTLKTGGHFPSDDAGTKLIRSPLGNITSEVGVAYEGGARS